MSIIRVLTDQGVKRVKIAGDRPTPEEEQLIRAEYQSVPPMNEMGGTQTMPMTPTLPQEPPQPPPPPELKPDPLTPDQREIVKAKAMQYEQSLQGPGMGTVATKLARPRFAGERPSQAEAAGGKGLGRTIAGTQGFVQGMVGDEERAKQIDQNLANLPYEPGVAGMAERLIQFSAIASPVSNLGKLRGAGRFTSEVAGGAVSGTIGHSGQQERLSDLLKDHPQLANPVTDFLASDPDDSFALGRFKSGLETAGLDAAVVGAFEVALKSMKGAARLLPGGETKLADEVAESVPKADPNHVVRPPINGQVQTAHAGQIQIPDKAVEAINKPIQKTLELGSRVIPDKLVRPIKSRVEAISPRIANRLDVFELDQNLLAGHYMARALPFLKSFAQMSKADRKEFSRYAMNSNMSDANDILRKYKRKPKTSGILREFDDLRKMFDDLHDLGKDNGLDIKYTRNYIPRIMKDYEGFMRSLGKEAKDPIDQAVDAAQSAKTDKLIAQANKQGLNPPKNVALTEFERREVIRKHLESLKYTGDGSPGFMKERVVDEIGKDQLKYYGSFEENVQNYISNLTYRVAKNRFSGEVDNVAGYTQEVARLLDEGSITKEQARTITELVDTRLAGGEKSIGIAGKIYRDLVYLTSIGNPISSITQGSEFMLNAYRNGTLETLQTAGKTLSGKGMRISDLGLEEIAKEFSEPLKYSEGLIGKASPQLATKAADEFHKKLNNILRFTLGRTGFKRMDELMKESALNGAFLKAQKQLAKKNSPAYKEFIQNQSRYFEGETQSLVDAIKRGDTGDPNVKVFLFSKLSKTQPISLSEYPEVYLKYPIMRPFYFLKSFGLKQLETTRREVLRKIGSTDPKEIKEGYKQGLRLSVLFGGIGMGGNNLFKDYLLDRDDKPGMTPTLPTGEKAWHAVADGLLTLIGLSRYSAHKIVDETKRTEGLTDLVLPPKTREILSGDVFTNEKNIPFGGKIYSEHFGSGADYKRKKRIEERNKKLRKRGLPPRTRPKRPTRP